MSAKFVEKRINGNVCKKNLKNSNIQEHTATPTLHLCSTYVYPILLHATGTPGTRVLHGRPLPCSLPGIRGGKLRYHWHFWDNRRTGQL